MDFYEFYKELYHKENDRRQEVINSMSIPIAVATGLSAGVYFLCTSFAYTVDIVCSTIFIVFLLVTVAALLYSIFYLGWALVDISKSYEYTGIASPGFLYDWHQKLKTHYKTHYAEQGDTLKMADDHFKRHLIDEYIKYTDYNQFVNDQKHARIYKAKVGLIICLASSTLGMAPYGYSFFRKGEDIHKIEIVKTQKISVSQNKRLKLMSKQTPPPPPPPPPGRLIKEGQRPPSPPPVKPRDK